MENQTDEINHSQDLSLSPNKVGNTKKDKLLAIINIALIVIIILMVIAIVIFVFIISPMTVSGNSMQNTLQNGDKIMILKVGYKLNHGDIIVFKKPTEKQPPIKRIVAMGGDIVRFDIKSNCWLVNEIAVDETTSYFENDLKYTSAYFSLAELEIKQKLLGNGLTVGDDELFVLGDNRNISHDSHNYGCIKKDWIKGKLI